MRAANTEREREPNIVRAILELAAAEAPTLTPDKLDQLEIVINARFADARFRIPRFRKHPTAEQREQIIKDALSPNLAQESTSKIANDNGIHPATLYRYLKRR